MEDSSLPLLMADAQAVAIWEGTTNVCSLDVLRAIKTRPASFEAFVSDCSRLLDEVDAQLRDSNNNKKSAIFGRYLRRLHISVEKVRSALQSIKTYTAAHLGKRPSDIALLRHYCFGLSRTYIAALLLHFAVAMVPPASGDAAAASVSELDYIVAIRWCTSGPLFENPLLGYELNAIDSVQQGSLLAEEDTVVALDIDASGRPRGCGDVCAFTGQKRAKL